MTGVVAAVDDLLFVAKLQEAAKRLDVPLVLARPSDDLTAVVRERRPALVIADLHAAAWDPIDVIRRIKADPDLRDTPVLGFFAHVRNDLREAAVEAGCDEVVPRSAFSARLLDTLRRWTAAADTTGPSRPPSGQTP